MTDLVFTSGIRRPEPLSFELDGETYTMLPAKEAINVLEGWSVWLFTGLNAYDWSTLDDDGKRAAHGLTAQSEDPEHTQEQTPQQRPDGWEGAQTKHIEARIRDNDDGLDVPMLEEIADKLLEKIAARPTT